LEQVEREISFLPRNNAGKEAFHAALSILYDRWDTLRMQVTSKQSTTEVSLPLAFIVVVFRGGL